MIGPPSANVERCKDGTDDRLLAYSRTTVASRQRLFLYLSGSDRDSIQEPYPLIQALCCWFLWNHRGSFGGRQAPKDAHTEKGRHGEQELRKERRNTGRVSTATSPVLLVLVEPPRFLRWPAGPEGCSHRERSSWLPRTQERTAEYKACIHCYKPCAAGSCGTYEVPSVPMGPEPSPSHRRKSV